MILGAVRATGCANIFNDRAFRAMEAGLAGIDVAEIKKLDSYLKKLFDNQKIRIVPRPKKNDSVEVYVGEEFIGIVSLDDEDGDRDYNFSMAILASDLE